MSETSLKDSSKDESGRRCDIYYDVIAIPPILYMVGLYVWSREQYETIYSHLPVSVILGGLDIIPCVIGLAWLIYRHGDKAVKRFPILESKWFIALIMLLLFFSSPIIEHIFKYLRNP